MRGKGGVVGAVGVSGAGQDNGREEGKLDIHDAIQKKGRVRGRERKGRFFKNY